MFILCNLASKESIKSLPQKTETGSISKRIRATNSLQLLEKKTTYKLTTLNIFMIKPILHYVLNSK